MTVYLKGYSIRVRQGFVTGSHGNFHFRNSHTNPEHAPPQLCHGRCFALLPEDPFYGLPVKTYETFPIIHKLVFKQCGRLNYFLIIPLTIPHYLQLKAL